MARVRPPIAGQKAQAKSLAEFFYPPTETTVEKRHRRRQELLEKALRKMKEKREEPYSLKDLAGEMHVHPRHMQRIFTSAGSPGFAFEMRRLRLARSKELLRQGKSITQTSRRLQYSHPSHFSKAFKKEYGLLPREWCLIVRQGS